MLSRLSDSGLVRVAELEEVFESARDWSTRQSKQPA